MATLPDKPSELIELALTDLEKCEAEPAIFEIEMSDWCRMPEEGGRCEICLAGSVMTQSLGFRFDLHSADCLDAEDGYLATPDDFGENEDALYALDALRCGEIDSALDYMGLDVPASRADEKGRWRRSVPSYHDALGPVAFKAAMRDLAADLRELGL